MKSFLFFIGWALLLSASNLSAQNLVPNPGFELYNNCPDSLGEIAYSADYSYFPSVQNWVSVTPWAADFFNACSSSSVASVPNNKYGPRAARSGNGYGGFVAYQQVWNYSAGVYYTYYSQYLESKLLSPMVAGKYYSVSYYLSLSSWHPQPAYSLVGLNQIAVHFSDSQITYSTSNPLAMSPDVADTSIYVTDTANWVKISGVYKAKGGEQWMTIGYFTAAPPATTKFVISDATVFQYSYVFVDDVSVTDSAMTGVEDHAISSPTIKVFPNPFYDVLQVENLPMGGHAIIMDVLGRKVCETVVSSPTMNLQLPELAKGTYFLQVFDQNKLLLQTERLTHW